MKKTITTLSLMLSFLLIGLSQNNSLDFDGTDDKVVISNPSELVLYQNLTIESWIITTNDNIQRILLNKEGEYQIKLSNGKILYALSNSNPGWTWVNTNYSIVDDVWTHISLTYDGSVVVFYVNGIEAFSQTSSGPIVDVNTSQNHFTIGHRQGPWESPFLGNIDEVRIWNVARSQTEIQDNMNIELSGTESGLIGYWDFNQGVPGGDNTGLTTLIDKTSNDNDGTLHNFALNGATSNWVGSGAPLSCSADNTFNATTDAYWDNPSNWSENCAPTSPISGNITINGDCTISSADDYSFESSSTLTINNGVTLTNNSTGTWSMNGTIINNGTYVKPTLTNEGTYKGSGQFNGNFINYGIISPGGN